MDNMLLSPAEYDRWYYTEKGKYISGFEKRILLKMINPPSRPFSKGGLGGILDIGCGTGYFTQFFGGLCRNTVGVDTSMDMIKYAVKNHGADNIKYIVADAENLPFKDRNFDISASITAVNFFKNPAKSVSEAVRVSRKKIFLGVLNRWSMLSFFKKLK
ncbi:MAG: class I SAM-dependent methyltransferase, partial [Nitrospinae bacterium]|nr:class I SAM-dependent methyltransferase [Nitrospinota bacterium]